MLTRKEKSIDSLIEAAKKCKEESIFQANEKYLKFKAKKNLSGKDMTRFFKGFESLQFLEEAIFWGQRFLGEKLCTKYEQYEMLVDLTDLSTRNNYHEMVIECIKARWEFPTDIRTSYRVGPNEWTPLSYKI